MSGRTISISRDELRHLGEPELCVHAVCVAGREHESPQALKVGMGQDRGHQLLGQPAAAMCFQDVDVGQIPEGRA